MKDIKRDLIELKYQFGFYDRISCSDEENQIFEDMLDKNKPLPDNVNIDYRELGTFYKYEKSDDISNEEFAEYMMFLQADNMLRQETYSEIQMKNIETIKNCVLFFTIVAIIGMFCALMFFLSTVVL